MTNNKHPRDEEEERNNNSRRTASSSTPSKEQAIAYEVIPSIQARAHINSMAQYRSMYEASIKDSDTFWADAARTHLEWFRDFDTPSVGNLTDGDVAWFLNGKLNVSTNCIDRHVRTQGDKVAIIWEADEPGQGKKITYSQLLQETCRVANVMKAQGIKKGDTVAIYMPMVPELAYTMLACARMGAVHSIVFAGFSADALRDRIRDAASQWVFTCDEGVRGGRTLLLKQTVDAAIAPLTCVLKVFVFQRTGSSRVVYHPTRDIEMTRAMASVRPYCPAQVMDSEDELFILYTSGSTGSPKGVVHTTAGYLLYAAMTTKYVFDVQDHDVFACVADCGWITGHSYIIYGPLACGATTLMFESTPMYPNAGRYWDVVQTHRVTQFYTAPTAIRALMACSPTYLDNVDRSSLRILGTVGEPINPEAWKWYYHQVGGGKCAIVDTYWQTETGGHIGTGLPGATPMKPGSCSFPFFGISFALMDNAGKECLGNDVEGRLCVTKPWPGMARTVYNDHARYCAVYLAPHPGYYFTGDGAYRDLDGYYYITGRMDDVLCTSGHRIGTAEIESALVAHAVVAEAAVIGFPHSIKGEGICCFVVLVHGIPLIDQGETMVAELKRQVRLIIGAFATPDVMIVTTGLPKTRSGKIMRRVLRKIAAGEADALGDISTMADPEVVQTLISHASTAMAGKKY